MEQAADSFHPRKRAALDLEEQAPSKRTCAEAPHLTLLEELYDLEGEDEEAAMKAPLVSATQEDLVVEMMKSLEKVIEGSEESREGEASTSDPCRIISPASSPALDFSWNNEEIIGFPSSPAQDTSFHGQSPPSFHGELEYKEEFKENDQIRRLLQASDDELGLPLSSSSSDLEESSFHEEWASLASESSAPASFNWLDVSFHQFEEGPVFTKEIFEPLLLF